MVQIIDFLKEVHEQTIRSSFKRINTESKRCFINHFVTSEFSKTYRCNKMNNIYI